MKVTGCNELIVKEEVSSHLTNSKRMNDVRFIKILTPLGRVGLSGEYSSGGH
jgi:osmotically-inducible protein OsmY